jgi:hypothetical protein
VMQVLGSDSRQPATTGLDTNRPYAAAACDER